MNETSSIPRAAAALLWLLLPLTAPPAAAHGAYHEVVDRLRAELRERPDDARLRLRLARTHAGHDEWRACLHELRRVDRLAPGELPTAALRGTAMAALGNAAGARGVLDGFLARHPGDAEALAARGKVLLQLGEPAAAVEDLRGALAATRPPPPELRRQLATALAAAGNFREAAAVLDAAELAAEALEMEIAAGDWDAALARIDALRAAAVQPAPWLARRARTLELAGRAEESRAAWAALRDHLLGLPNLERGAPHHALLLAEARHALHEPAPAPVAAPPAP